MKVLENEPVISENIEGVEAIAVLEKLIEENIELRNELKWRNQSEIKAPLKDVVEVCQFYMDGAEVGLKRGYCLGEILDNLDGAIFWRPETTLPNIKIMDGRLPTTLKKKMSSKPKIVLRGYSDASEKPEKIGVGIILERNGEVIHRASLMRDVHYNSQSNSTASELRGMVYLVETAKHLYKCTHLTILNDNVSAIKIANEAVREGNLYKGTELEEPLNELIAACNEIAVNFKHIPRENNRIADKLSKKIWLNNSGIDNIKEEPEILPDLEKPYNSSKLYHLLSISKEGTSVIPKEVLHKLGAIRGDCLKIKFENNISNRAILTISRK